MKEFLLFIHQLPQNLFGCILYLINIKSVKKHKRFGITYYIAKHVSDCGVSLGKFIFLDSDVYHYDNDIKHEHGHQLQSKKIGWLYLIIIGLPSAIGNLIDRVAHKKHRKDCWYYKQPWEAGADKLGGVVRE